MQVRRIHPQQQQPTEKKREKRPHPTPTIPSHPTNKRTPGRPSATATTAASSAAQSTARTCSCRPPASPSTRGRPRARPRRRTRATRSSTTSAASAGRRCGARAASATARSCGPACWTTRPRSRTRSPLWNCMLSAGLGGSRAARVCLVWRVWGRVLRKRSSSSSSRLVELGYLLVKSLEYHVDDEHWMGVGVVGFDELNNELAVKDCVYEYMCICMAT